MAISDLSDLIGKEFEYGGKGPDKYDCYNLCREVLRRNDIIIPEFMSSDDKCLIHQTITEGKEMFKRVLKPLPFSIVTFRIYPKYVTHVGVVLNYPYFIHIMQKCRAVIERLDAPEWSRRTEGFYQWAN